MKILTIYINSWWTMMRIRSIDGAERHAPRPTPPPMMVHRMHNFHAIMEWLATMPMIIVFNRTLPALVYILETGFAASIESLGGGTGSVLQFFFCSFTLCLIRTRSVFRLYLTRMHSRTLEIFGTTISWWRASVFDGVWGMGSMLIAHLLWSYRGNWEST